MTGYIIEIQVESDASDLDLETIERLATNALEAEHVSDPAELSIVLADDVTVRELNRAYRETDAVTDVLSFAQSEGEDFAQPEDAARHLGDVVISLDTARRQAVEYAQPLRDEVSHLLVHGVLHLLGYDHEQPDDAAIMRAHEDAILGEAHHH